MAIRGQKIIGKMKKKWIFGISLVNCEIDFSELTT